MRNPPWSLERLLCDILFFVCRIEWKTSGCTFDKFDNDADLKDIVSSNFIKFGEACTRLINNYPEITVKYPDVSWRGIRETRNLVAHLYERIDWRDIWEDVEALSSLRERLLDILKHEGLTSEIPDNLDRYEPEA